MCGLIDAYTSTDQNTGQWAVNIQFNSRGAEIFSELTRRIVGVNTKRIAVFLDDEELIAPVSQAWIRDGRSQITGNFTREEARTISIQLESGRLPVPLILIQESEVDALLGAASLERSLIAGLVGLGLVMIFMMAYYRMGGLVASVALVFYSVVVLAIFKLIPITLTLPHIGGFILSVGLAVDANILIFERISPTVGGDSGLKEHFIGNPITDSGGKTLVQKQSFEVTVAHRTINCSVTEDAGKLEESISVSSIDSSPLSILTTGPD